MLQSKLKLCFASNNPHKLSEIRAILHFCEILSVQEAGGEGELIEDKATLEENSEQKARTVFERTSLPSFADDTGLEVDALDGAPGVLSARYAGSDCNAENNIALVLKNVEGKRNRKAKFRTIITYITSTTFQQFEGVLKGKIIDAPQGSYGFGYDSIFVPRGYRQTLAELTAEEKNKISHRKKAIQKMYSFLKQENKKIAFEKSWSIKTWSPDDRPREKMVEKGAQALSDGELLAILIGSGTPQYSAVELARHILNESNNDLHQVARLSVHDLMNVKGIGLAKAVSIVAALELGRRRKDFESAKKPKITSSHDAYQLIRGDLMDLTHEEFWVLLVNQANILQAKQRVSEGGVTETVVDPKIIFRHALLIHATGILLAHNHPSGNLSPSKADIALTHKIKEAGKVLDIRLIDHIIVGGQKYYSFMDEGEL